MRITLHTPKGALSLNRTFKRAIPTMIMPQADFLGFLRSARRSIRTTCA
jgi:hypothetical protein